MHRSVSITDSSNSSLSESSTGYNSDIFEIENETNKLLDDSPSDDQDDDVNDFLTKSHFQASLSSIRITNKDTTSSTSSSLYNKLDCKPTNSLSRTNTCTAIGAIF